MNHYINMLLILQAKADGRPVMRATLYSILHTCKDGSTVNLVVQAKMVSNPFYYIQFYSCMLLSLYMGACGDV